MILLAANKMPVRTGLTDLGICTDTFAMLAASPRRWGLTILMLKALRAPVVPRFDATREAPTRPGRHSRDGPAQQICGNLSETKCQCNRQNEGPKDYSTELQNQLLKANSMRHSLLLRSVGLLTEVVILPIFAIDLSQECRRRPLRDRK